MFVPSKGALDREGVATELALNHFEPIVGWLAFVLDVLGADLKNDGDKRIEPRFIDLDADTWLEVDG